MKRSKLWLAIAAGVMMMVGIVIADDAPDIAAQKSELAKLQFLVGSWKGVAQPQRGSTKGSWIEQAEWAWRFDGEKAKLAAKLDDSKVFADISLQAGDKADEFVLLGTPSGGGEPVRYAGQVDKSGKLTLEADKPAELPARITIRTVAGGDRLLMLYEKQRGPSNQFTRLAEVGYTRKGSGFGKGSSGPECVVTGGFGSIEVTHEGKTYYVCCTGCRNYFNDNPEEVLAEYAARKAEEKRAATSKE